MSAVRLWLGFLAMCLGLFMAVLDVQVVASALTSIGVALHIAPERLGWIQTGYLMAEIIAIPLTGFLTRAFTLRWMFAAATAGFTLASLGCAASTTLPALITLRILQGLCGGVLIPAVFTSVFVMIPEPRQVFATTLAGIFAVVAPTLGPFVGGYFTEHFSWNWIFLINLAPGVLVTFAVVLCVRVGAPEPGLLRRLDYGTLVFASVFLAALELLLNEAPQRHWRGAYVFTIAGVTALSGVIGALRALTHASPFVDLRRFRKPGFSLGCALSFVLGMGLYGSVYSLALFLGLVRDHSPLQIGETMMVFGAAQLLTAPLAAWAETRIDNRLLAAAGFSLFAAGLWLNGAATKDSDFWPLFWPQAVRGLGVKSAKS
jgi:MFS transporter, DHA2 family, multidrug resistance protein